ncbi:MAG: tryptophan synthase subunit alpha [Myxococcota bacterium]
MTDRFHALTARCRAEDRGVFVPFLVIGDPEPGLGLSLALELVKAGADALELGLPFSDPPADGPVIQAADQRALAAGMTTPKAFEWLAALREQTDVPVSLLVYLNLVMQYGVEAFYAQAAAVGVDAVLIADLPPEHSEMVLGAARRHHVSTVFLASELSSPQRLARIGAVCRGYVYALARVGITGTRDDVDPALGPALSRMANTIDLPLLVGFGISRPAHVRAALAAGADGVIVGSALVRHIAEHAGDAAAMRDAIAASARDLAQAARGLHALRNTGEP